ncbi:MAG: hypothetical protein HW416_1851 [Chloroflexi bacterium]|nr:hypothetical protein [Chloroflexota bacterium]
MYNGQKVIDIHGDMTPPPLFRAHAINIFRENAKRIFPGLERF